MEMDSKFHVGDRVLVGSVSRCVFGFNDDMEEMEGKCVTIRRVVWNQSYKHYEYNIEENGWYYDDSCFEFFESVELPEFDVSAVDILSLLS